MGGCFCRLDQTHLECESTSVEIMSFCPRNREKTPPQKKGHHRKLKSFCPRNQVKAKKNSLQRNLGLNSAGICGIHLCCQALFRLNNQRLNLDGGTLTLEGGPPESPYNLSTGYR